MERSSVLSADPNDQESAAITQHGATIVQHSTTTEAVNRQTQDQHRRIYTSLITCSHEPTAAMKSAMDASFQIKFIVKF